MTDVGITFLSDSILAYAIPIFYVPLNPASAEI